MLLALYCDDGCSPIVVVSVLASRIANAFASQDSANKDAKYSSFEQGQTCSAIKGKDVIQLIKGATLPYCHDI